jgi:hypothetical protein
MLRGFIVSKFPDQPILHQHETSGFIYIYPRVQYKVIDGTARILGIDEGAEIFKEDFSNIGCLKLGDTDYEIKDREILDEEVDFGENALIISYSFLTPWLALNEKNYDKYQRLGSWAKKKELLEKILIGNIISMSKSLGYTVPEPIKANIAQLKEVPTSLKGTPMLGFLGTFSINFEIPDYWGIGKSVSRGFGTVVKQKTDKQKTEVRLPDNKE